MVCTEVIEPFSLELRRSCKRLYIREDRRLVTTFVRHLVQDGRQLVAGLDVAVHVVGKEQDVLVLFVAEILGCGSGRNANQGTLHRVLIHLGEEHAGVFEQVVLFERHVQFVAFTNTLTDAGEERQAAAASGQCY